MWTYDIVYIFRLKFSNSKKNSNVNFSSTISQIYSNFQDIIRFHSILLIATSLLYIPIMRHVRKFSYLPSSQKNRPEKYILYQTITVAAFRTVNFESLPKFRISRQVSQNFQIIQQLAQNFQTFFLKQIKHFDYFLIF